MPPRSVKDLESTHNCTQVFVVISCQPKALRVRARARPRRKNARPRARASPHLAAALLRPSPQVDIGPHTYLLCPGDHFFVPQSCEYRLMNFSDTPGEVAFVVIKPRPAEGGGGAEGGGAEARAEGSAARG